MKKKNENQQQKKMLKMFKIITEKKIRDYNYELLLYYVGSECKTVSVFDLSRVNKFN